MKQIIRACFSLLAAVLLLVLGASAYSQQVHPRHADVVFSQDFEPPDATSQWQRVELPFSFDRSTAW